MLPVEVLVLEHALKYRMENAVRALCRRGNKQTLVYNLSSPCICLMYLLHVFKGYLSSSVVTMGSWDPSVLKVLISVFKDMYSRQRFTSAKTLVSLILGIRLLEIIVYYEQDRTATFVLEKMNEYLPTPTDWFWNNFAETYHLKRGLAARVLDTCKNCRQYIKYLLRERRHVEDELADIQGVVATVRRLAYKIAADISATIPQTGLEKILAGEKLQLDKDTEQIIHTVIHANVRIREKHLLQLLKLQETIEHPPVELNALMDNL